MMMMVVTIMLAAAAMACYWSMIIGMPFMVRVPFVAMVTMMIIVLNRCTKHILEGLHQGRRCPQQPAPIPLLLLALSVNVTGGAAIAACGAADFIINQKPQRVQRHQHRRPLVQQHRQPQGEETGNGWQGRKCD